MKKITKKYTKKGCDDDEPFVTAPKLDKLTGVINVQDEKLHGLAYNTALSNVQHHEEGYAQAASSSQYPLSIKVYYSLPDGVVNYKGPFVLLQFTSKKASKRQVRIEYNPTYMTEVGEQHLDVQFVMLFGMGFYEFLFYARFTRVDFCRNVMWRSPEDYLFRAAWTKVSHCHFSPATGRLQTINLGKSGGTQYLVYDKAKQLYGEAADHSTIRVEAVRRGSFTFDELATLPNPFKRLTVYSIACKKPPFGIGHWRAFQDACRLRGVGNAIKQQPVHYRGKLKKALSELPVSWWEITDNDWNWLLTDALDKAGLMNIPNNPPPLTLANGVGQAA